MYEHKIERYGPELAPVVSFVKNDSGSNAFYDGGRCVKVEFAVTTDSTACITVSEAEGIYFSFGGTGKASYRELKPYVETAVIIWRRAYQDFETTIPEGDWERYSKS